MTLVNRLNVVADTKPETVEFMRRFVADAANEVCVCACLCVLTNQ